MLRRLWRYAEKRWHVSNLLSTLTDSRVHPHYTTATATKAALLGMLARAGSLHALAGTRTHAIWGSALTQRLPSDDTLGEVFTQLRLDGLRTLHHRLYEMVCRSKSYSRSRPLAVAVIDGHEVNASYRRGCPGSLQRKITVTTRAGVAKRIQYYHRYVYLLLLGTDGPLPLDLERQLPGEDELATARRLVTRVCTRYPRAFTVLLADGLYANAPFINFLREQGKHLLAVLKDDRRDVVKDVRGMCPLIAPEILRHGTGTRKYWDIAQLTSMPGVAHPVRVIRTCETSHVRRQQDRVVDTTVSEWMWVCTLSREQLDTETAIALGHKRWVIENELFNELVTVWHGKHIYRNEVNAIEGFQLLLLFAYNLFHLFVRRNLQPCLRERLSLLYVANAMHAELNMLTLPP